ncbi:hypothetical protein Tco_0860032 [Tanacetum coccineum]|uniref:Uncharacterized protein n=1 Tax=Tanacetum coccineum TaxID=301880 RepID=A0ABQ5BDR3_9ASTR
MVACLEKIEGNSDFHEIVDFLASSLIHHALTINAPVNSKASYSVTEASIRSSLLFNDADGTTCLTNEAIFQNLALMGYEAEGEGSGEPTEPQPTPSHTQPSTGDQPPETSSSHATTQDSRDTLEGTNRNEGDQELSVLCTNLSNRVLVLESIKDAQTAKISALKSRIKKLEKKCKPSISHHKAWLKSVKRVSMKKRFGKRESYMETEEAVDEGRQSGKTEEVKLTDDIEVVEDKGSGNKGGNAEELVSTARPEIKEEKAKEKGVSIKDVDDSSRPARSILTLKPLLTIDPKDKGKGVLKESPVKKVKRSDRDAAQIAKDAEIARLDQAFVDYIASLYDEVQAKMDASKDLAARLQMEEREIYTIEERSEKDENMIDKINKKAVGMDEEEVSESTKVEVKKEGQEKQLRASLNIVPGEEEEIDYEVLGTRYPIVNWESAFYHIDRYGVPHDYYRVFRADGSSRYIKTFTEMVSRFDRLDFIELHSLVMQRFSTTTPEGIDLVLWGDLRIMFEETADEDIWKNQEK